ncbi:DUF2235 domain-containing protein [uncultured Brevundimonas sp.]|uniref:phospholipase effector Tle1 domain-containing protein n=1 Tax=uncultured Brevundimonas sp. TaxID=213418 RepID=UPI0030EC43CA|tara:strand:+ start:1497 stop:2900 length:1404 start_codon:yes stop_codon:yes gene_type:complete
MKRLVFCFDGTWNRLEAPFPTNVVITAESVDPLDGDHAQLIYYDEGVGTSFLQSLAGGVFGVGMVANLAQAYRFLIFNFSPGDEIYVFGFSRGAYTARSFVGLLRNCGILRRAEAARASEAIELYKSRRDSTHSDSDAMRQWRLDFTSQVVVSDDELAWRRARQPETDVEEVPLLKITYLGVWDTVGSLGIPFRYRWWFDPANRRHAFHDTRVTDFVNSARHAVALDERRRDFQPTLWESADALNKTVGVDPDDELAPYQQKWFPGTHGSVGGGGPERGLSDQALDWVLSGARRRGLKLDSTSTSRIYSLNPSHLVPVDNVPPGFSFMGWIMGLFPSDRRGPRALYEVSLSARRRYLESAEALPERCAYRPGALKAVAADLDALDPAEVGLGQPYSGLYSLYEVRARDALGKLAKRFYGDAQQWPSLYRANPQIEDANRIYPGWILKIPNDPWVEPASKPAAKDKQP